MSNDSKRTTIRDIAEVLNLSVSTVSRALQGNSRISKETIDAVKRTAEKMDYYIHGPAAALRKGHGNNIGVVVPRVDRQFFSNIIGGIEEVLRTNGFNTFIYQTQESYENEKSGVQAMLNAGVEGLMISVSVETKDISHINRFSRSGRPVVFFDRCMDDSETCRVMIDDFAAAYKATEHLLANGCRKLVYFGGTQNLFMYRNRREGFEQALLDHGFAPGDIHVIDGMLTRKKGYDSFRELYEAKQIPDGLLAASDFSALGSILFMKEVGISVPDDVCVVGFANESFTEFMEPPLSSIEQFAGEMGKKTAEMMLRRFTGVQSAETIILNSELKIRKSSQRTIK
ncbi:MAG: LacI family DNA-binding transcriptional regulator [Bacteroidota bacterium]|nr:LacI family DNA-binding transcriptional regulator [Bacteroidota bacterium]